MLSSEAPLSAFYALAGFSWYPGLLEALQSADSPSCDWLEGLTETIPTIAWGVYVLVYRKEEECDAVYYLCAVLSIETYGCTSCPAWDWENIEEGTGVCNVIQYCGEIIEYSVV